MSKIPSFGDIKQILDNLVRGKEDNLHIYHGANFKWESKQELVEATVERDSHVFRLIDPGMVGAGLAEQTYLVRILTCGIDLDGDGINEYPRMPYLGNIDGEYAAIADLAKIVTW